MCEWGRQTVESWGRKKRSVSHTEGEATQDEEMNISQEIIVLDFGDERQSTDFLRSDKPGGIASEANFGGKFLHLHMHRNVFKSYQLRYKLLNNLFIYAFQRRQ